MPDTNLESQFEAAQEATPGDLRREDLAPPARKLSREGVGWLWRGYRRRYQELPRWTRYVGAAILIALAACIPLLLPYITADTAYWTNILTKIGIAVLLALGLNVVVGFAGLLDFVYVVSSRLAAYGFGLLAG